MYTQVQQPLSSQRATHCDTATYIAKTVVKQKSRLLGPAADAPLKTQESCASDVSNVNRHSDSVAEIAAEPICPEGSEASCVKGGKGRGSCGRGRPFETLSATRKTPHHHAQPRERSVSPKQDFADAPGSPQSPTISR